MKINSKELVKETRVELRLTQARLAKELGVTVQQISHWERGTRQVSKQTALALQCLLLKS